MAKTSSEFAVGYLMWAKIGSYPYWPCIISTSPGTQIFQKPAKKGSLVHVHFFGDNGKHSWVSSSSLMVFRGIDEFNKLKFKSGDTAKPQPGFLVKSNLKFSWDSAVKEIEDVQKLDVSKRLDLYYSMYPLKMFPKGKAAKRKDEFVSEEVPAKISKSAPPKKAIKAAVQNGDFLIEEIKTEVVAEPKSKKTKSAPPKKAIKAAAAETLYNGELEFEYKPEELKPESAKSKKEAKNKKSAPFGLESIKPEPADSVVKSTEDSVPVIDLKPVLRKLTESLQAFIGDKKQLSIAKSLVEKVAKLGAHGELTDKTDVK